LMLLKLMQSWMSRDKMRNLAIGVLPYFLCSGVDMCTWIIPIRELVKLLAPAFFFHGVG
jgi:hypothetical protein